MARLTSRNNFLEQMQNSSHGRINTNKKALLSLKNWKILSKNLSIISKIKTHLKSYFANYNRKPIQWYVSYNYSQSLLIRKAPSLFCNFFSKAKDACKTARDRRSLECCSREGSKFWEVQEQDQWRAWGCPHWFGEGSWIFFNSNPKMEQWHLNFHFFPMTGSNQQCFSWEEAKENRSRNQWMEVKAWWHPNRTG